MLECHEQDTTNLAIELHLSAVDVIVQFENAFADSGAELKNGREAGPVFCFVWNFGVRLGKLSGKSEAFGDKIESVTYMALSRIIHIGIDTSLHMVRTFVMQ